MNCVSKTMTDKVEQCRVTCKRCNQVLANKSVLKRHLLKKTICHPCNESSNYDPLVLIAEIYPEKQYNIKTFDCKFCKKKFNHQSNRYAHEKVCKEHPQCRKEIEQLVEKAIVQKLKAQSSNAQIITNNNSYQTQNNVVIQLNSVGQETLNHLSTDFLTRCIINENDGMQSLLQEIHFNQTIPENNNIRLKSSKNNLLEKYEDGRWMPCDKNNTLDQMIRRGYRILYRHFIDNIEEPDIRDREEQIQGYFMKLIGRKDQMYYELRRNLYLMIMDSTLYIVGI